MVRVLPRNKSPAKKSPSHAKTIVFFVGQDIVALKVLNEVLFELVKNFEFKPLICFVDTPERAKPQNADLKRYALLESRALREKVFPFLESNTSSATKTSTPRQLQHDWKFSVHYLRDVNSTETIDLLKNLGAPPMLGVSIRCLQKFSDPVIQFFDEGMGLINAHPGILPDYRGLCATFHTCANALEGNRNSGSKLTARVGCTVHRIEAGQAIDKGPILQFSDYAVDPSMPIFDINLNFVKDSAARALLLVLNSALLNGGSLQGYPQSPLTGRHYFLPTDNDVGRWQDLGVTFANRESWIGHIVDLFSLHGSPHACTMEGLLLDIWKECTAGSDVFFKSSRGGRRKIRPEGSMNPPNRGFSPPSDNSGLLSLARS